MNLKRFLHIHLNPNEKIILMNEHGDPEAVIMDYETYENLILSEKNIKEKKSIQEPLADVHHMPPTDYKPFLSELDTFKKTFSDDTHRDKNFQKQTIKTQDRLTSDEILDKINDEIVHSKEQPNPLDMEEGLIWNDGSQADKDPNDHYDSENFENTLYLEENGQS